MRLERIEILQEIREYFKIMRINFLERQRGCCVYDLRIGGYVYKRKIYRIRKSFWNGKWEK